MESDNKETKVLVSGASGYIAAHIVQQLLQAGYQVRGTVRSLKNESKVAPLKKLGEEGENRLELVEADLLNADCWKDAVEGCTYVMHTASPFLISNPSDENVLIKPAVDGTLNVLKACAGKVKRVVLTSSTVSVGVFPGENGRKLSENDWTDLKGPGANTYVKSKKLAEEAAWDFLKNLDDSEKFELAVINPSFVLGPSLTQHTGTSVEVFTRIFTGKDFFLPKISFPIVDVRDVAKAHVVALTSPEASGNRHIITCGDLLWATDVGAKLKEEFGPQGYSPTTRTMPKFLLAMAALFNGEAKAMKLMWDVMFKFDNTRMKQVLGIEPYPVKDTLVDMAYSLIESGKIPKTSKYRGRPNSS